MNKEFEFPTEDHRDYKFSKIILNEIRSILRVKHDEDILPKIMKIQEALEVAHDELDQIYTKTKQ